MFKLIASSLLAAYVAAKETWSHAEIHYGEPNQIEGELKDFLNTQPQIKRIHVEGVPTVQLHMYAKKDDEKSSETLFASYVPVSMVKDILDDKSLL